MIEMAACKGVNVGEKSAPQASSKRIVSATQKQIEKPRLDDNPGLAVSAVLEDDIDVDLREVYFLIMHFLSSGPCNRASGQLWNELLQHRLLPRRYHAWYSRSGVPSGDEDDDGSSFPLSYIQVVERHPNIEKNHLVKLLRQHLTASRRAVAALEPPNSRIPTAADIPTLLGLGQFSLLDLERTKAKEQISQWLLQLRWPHWQSDQVHGLALRELGGGFARHHRSPSIRAASYAVAKPSILVDRIQIIKKFRGHRNAVYCAIFDRSGQHIITGSDDRLVKIWSTETGFCLRSCRGHEGDITDLAVSSGNALVASASNDCTIRVWRLPDGLPVSVLRGHTGGVTAIAFSPRQSCKHHLLSSSDDGTCRIWDARDSSVNSRVYMPKPDTSSTSTKLNVPAQPIAQAGNQILCCAFNADGSIFVTGSSDRFARVWDARKWNDEITGKPNHELDVLKGHENDVNYVQFSGCAGPVKPLTADSAKEEGTAKFKNSWFAHESIVTCSRDGSAIIWTYKCRRKHARSGRWVKAYHLRVPPPPMPPQPPRGGGPRQRLLPTPRGVNMIVWSLDNRFVLAAIMDCRICVWNAVDGSLVHSLTGHDKSTYVLDVHPFNPRIAMSAGYDGRVIIWDIWEGRPVRIYETGDFDLVDGNFSPDGTSIVVSDEVGQIYLLATGHGESQKDAKYDQFFLGDFRPLVRDILGNVLDQETQLPPHQRNIQDLLCDANMIPYPEPYQSMYQQRRLGALGIDWHPPSVNFAVGTMDDVTYIGFGDNPLALHPVIGGSPGDMDRHAVDGTMRWVEQPTDIDETMDWEQDVTRLSDDSGSDYSVSEESLSLLDDEGTASSTEGIANSDEEEVDSKDDSIQETQLRRSNRNKRKDEGMASTSFGRRVRRKQVDSQETDEASADATDRRSARRRQAKDSRLLSPAMRPAFQQQSARPKRLAAKNALQFFSHINTNEEEDEDEQTSSQHDISSYSTEREPESDGPPLSPLSSGQKDEHEKEEISERDEKLEISERDEKDENFERDEKVEIFERDEKGEVSERDEKKENSERDEKEEDSERDEKEEDSERYEKEENSERCEKEENSERDLSAKLELSELGEFSRRPRSQRRLVLKLRNSGARTVESKIRSSRDDQADVPSVGEQPLLGTDQNSALKVRSQRRLRRLVVRPPKPAPPTYQSVGGIFDIGDNGDDYNGIANGGETLKTSYSDETQPPEVLRRLSNSEKRKWQLKKVQASKRAKAGGGAASIEPLDSSPVHLVRPRKPLPPTYGPISEIDSSPVRLVRSPKPAPPTYETVGGLSDIGDNGDDYNGIANEAETLRTSYSDEIQLPEVHRRLSNSENRKWQSKKVQASRQAKGGDGAATIEPLDSSPVRLVRPRKPAPPTYEPTYEIVGGLSDIGDNGDNGDDYNGIAKEAETLKTSYSGEIQPPEVHRRLSNSEKRKWQSKKVQASKRAKGGDGAATIEPLDSSPVSLSCSSDRSASNLEGHHDASGALPKGTFPDVALRTTSHDRGTHQRGTNNLSVVARIGFSKPLAEGMDLPAEDIRRPGRRFLENRVERQPSPNAVVRFKPVDSRGLEVPLDQADKKIQCDRRIMTRSGTSSRQSLMENSTGTLQYKNMETRLGHIPEIGGAAAGGRHKQEEVEKVIPAQVYSLRDGYSSKAMVNGTELGIGVNKGRRTWDRHPLVQNSEKLEDHDESHFSQPYDGGGENNHLLKENTSRKATVRTRGALKQNNVFEGCEKGSNRIDRENMNGVTQDPLREKGEPRQDMSGGNSESDFLQDHESWSESRSEEETAEDDVQNLRHKRRTLGELDSTNNMLPNSSEDFMCKTRIRHMRSVMSEGGRETRSKSNREIQFPVNKGKETPDKSGSRRRRTRMEPISWYESCEGRGKWRQGRHKDAADDEQAKNPDREGSVESHRMRGLDLHGVGEDGASVLNERKGLRVSSRARREIRRRDTSWDRDQGRLSETNTASRDKGVRTRKSSAWLMLSEVEEGTRYIPQYGDEVAYLRQGHQEFLESEQIDEPGPWMTYKNSIGAVEFCRVAELDYAILPDSGDTCCKLTLEFSDRTSKVYGKTFWLSLPELTNFPDFLVEKSRYDAAIQRNWTSRDKCQVWWRSADGKGGSWWDGRVVSVKCKSSEFPDSPWERFHVQYKGDTSKPLTHSPWELFDSKSAMWEPPRIDKDRRVQLSCMLEAAANEPEDIYGLRRLKQSACRSDFINRLPLPLTLDIIKPRLENDYYRSIRAFYFDVELIISNAKRYYGSDSEMAEKMQRFATEILEDFSPATLATCESHAQGQEFSWT